ncbi:lipoyl(octanoyl) transferase LipB [Acetobacteraceae bacterium H6797]|nr:lipoyl(octanoyl) transferase LipB [Acetobacteraceae bacterium H6797]
MQPELLDDRNPFRPDALEWRISEGLVDYPSALAEMQARVEAIRAGQAGECVWLLEHPPTYTAGTSANRADLVEARFPVFDAGRGGQWTYHGPGQRIGYVMLDLTQRGRDVRHYVHQLEEWLIRTLERFEVRGERREGRVGIWVTDPVSGREDKIAAIGVRVTRWVTWHGIALNVEPELSHFEGIVPCGIREHGVTSLLKLGLPVTMADVDAALMETWPAIF